MIKIFKNYLFLCVFTTVISLFVHTADARVETSGNDGFSCNESNSSYRCNDGELHETSDKIYHKVIKSFAEKPANGSKREGTVTGNTMAIEVSSPDIISDFVRRRRLPIIFLAGVVRFVREKVGRRNLGI